MKQEILIRTIVVATTALLLSSCARKTSTDIQMAATSQATEIIVTRKADTLVRIPADTARGSRPLADITNDRPLVFETPTQRVSVYYDAGTGNIQAEAITIQRDIPVTIEETTIHRTNESAIETSEVRTTDTKPSPWLSPWPWLLIVLVVVIFGLWIKRTFWI